MNPNELHNNNNMNNDRISPYPLRMPPEMRETLEAIAKTNGRSLNAEIVQRLENSLFIAENKEQSASPLKIIEMLMQFATASPNPSEQLISLSKVLSEAASNIKKNEIN